MKNKSMSSLYLFVVIFTSVILASCNSGIKSDKFYEVINESELQNYDLNKNQLVPWGLRYQNIQFKPLSSKKIRVAIMDSGIDASHKDLEGKVLKEYNAIEDNVYSTSVDVFGHGTAIAGIISAIDNDFGILGVTQNVELVSVKVLDDEGRGNIDDFVKGIKWCIENDVEIINMSFGIMRDHELLKESINEAVNNGILIVASVGNKFRNEVDYPAAYQNVISVTGIDSFEKKLSSAATGKVDFSAPGVDVLSLAPGDKYGVFTGTSYATAYITGAIANILSAREIEKNQSISSVVKEELVDISKDIGNKGYDELFGYGSLSK
ncbi:S8 family serine peptidase [Paenibacillus yanchengensis]|uniref:S8 family serine peptidase n=1 Tax=Paenibacillus yanchengensis TaxID=2035833 RepID=A0ABW4YFD2_9BACL